jgi:signal transduction histidine kinase
VDGFLHTNGDPQPLPGDYIQLSVSDSGIGIPPADQAKLFQTFHRAGNVGNRSGTGMGLAIVKKLVDLHRGMIRIESTEGKGTTACVWLPIASAEGAAWPPPVEPGEAGEAANRELAFREFEKQ